MVLKKYVDKYSILIYYLYSINLDLKNQKALLEDRLNENLYAEKRRCGKKMASY